MAAGPEAPINVLYRATSRRTRLLGAGAAAASFVAKVAVVLTALGVVVADATSAAVLGVVAGVAFAAQRVLASAARVGAECDLYRAATRVLLDGDVLGVPAVNPLRSLFEAGYVARQLLADTLPDVLASGLAALVVVPLLARELPLRVLAITGAAAAVVALGALAIRKLSVAWQERMLEAQTDVRERTAVAVEGRLELVAAARAERVTRALDGAIDRYRRTVDRASIASAFLGRAPIVAGAATVALVVLLDGASREAVSAVVFGKALLLASALPIVLGSILGVSELVRVGPSVRPLADLLAAPRRPELLRGATARVVLPAPVSVRDVTFAYHEAKATLEGVSLEWPAGSALVLEGRNGSGKSTLLRLLLGLRDPSRGAIAVDGRALEDVDVVQLRQDVAYLPQRPYLGEPYVTVRGAIHVLEPDASDAAIERVLERVALAGALRGREEEPLDVPVGELSAGQRQRLALARVLLRDAPLVLLDEPDANLDRAGIQLVAELVAELVASGKMVAVVAHTAELAAIPGVRVSLG